MHGQIHSILPFESNVKSLQEGREPRIHLLVLKSFVRRSIGWGTMEFVKGIYTDMECLAAMWFAKAQGETHKVRLNILP